MRVSFKQDERSADPRWAAGMNAPWLIWAGWTFVGTVAQVISLLAIVFTAVEILSRRREVNRPWIDVDNPASKFESDDPTTKVELVDFYNAGSRELNFTSFIVIGGVLVPHDGERFQRILMPGARVRLHIRPDQEPTDVWFFIMWRSNADRRYWTAEWRPMRDGALSQSFYNSFAQPTWWRRLTPNAFRRTRPVGPGQAAQTFIRVGTSDKRIERDLIAVMGKDFPDRIMDWASRP
jgi:hypothetical protein